MFSFPACSGKRHVQHETSTTTTRGADAAEVTTKTSSTTEESSSSGGCGGILSCTVDAVGAVIAFPFKLVGGLITAIF